MKRFLLVSVCYHPFILQANASGFSHRPISAVLREAVTLTTKVYQQNITATDYISNLHYRNRWQMEIAIGKLEDGYFADARSSSYIPANSIYPPFRFILTSTPVYLCKKYSLFRRLTSSTQC